MSTHWPSSSFFTAASVPSAIVLFATGIKLDSDSGAAGFENPAFGPAAYASRIGFRITSSIWMHITMDAI